MESILHADWIKKNPEWLLKSPRKILSGHIIHGLGAKKGVQGIKINKLLTQEPIPQSLEQK